MLCTNYGNIISLLERAVTLFLVENDQKSSSGYCFFAYTMNMSRSEETIWKK